jgi:SAM-dependent methyltransferase
MVETPWESPDFDPAPFHRFEHAGWERAAEHYATSFGGLTAQTAEAVLDAVGAGAGRRILDVASGPGYVAGAAASRGSAVVGLDFSPTMVAQATARYPGVSFREGDAEALPFDNGSFDAVVMNFGILHLARPDAAIAEARRVLRPGGRYAFTVWAAPEQAAGFGMVLTAIEAHGRSDIGLPEGPPFFAFSDPDRCRTALTRAGFPAVSVRTLPLVWRLSSPDAVFDAVSEGGVRTAAVLRGQTRDAIAAIRAAVRDATAQYARNGAYEIPMPAVLAVGTRD